MANYNPPEKAESVYQGPSGPPPPQYSGSLLEHGQTAAGPRRGESTESKATSSYQPPQHHTTSGSYHHETAFAPSSHPPPYAQSAPHPPPCQSPAVSSPPSAYNQSASHPPPRQSPPPHQSSPLSSWEQKPPAMNRTPKVLYNKSCGTRYIGIGNVTALHHSLFEKAACSETMLFFQVLTCIFYYRCNMVSRKGCMSPQNIRQLFGTGIERFKFSLNEIYKRMLVRMNKIESGQLKEFKWWDLPQWELDNVREYINRIGTFIAKDGKVHKLFEFGADENGKQWMRIRPGPIPLYF